MAAESELDKKLRKYAEEKGCLFLKTAIIGRRGFPDRMLIGTNGNLMLMELKAPNGVVSHSQDRCLADLARRGIKVAVVWNRDQGKGIIDDITRKGSEPGR